MELTAAQAGEAIGLSHQAIRNHVEAGRLIARRHGIRRSVRVDVGDLRTFAQKYNYRINEAFLAQLASPVQN